MSTTIMECLQNANYNINKGASGMNFIIGKEQLNNAVQMLEKDYPLDFEMDELLDQYGGVDNVPEFSESNIKPKE